MRCLVFVVVLCLFVGPACRRVSQRGADPGPAATEEVTQADDLVRWEELTGLQTIRSQSIPEKLFVERSSSETGIVFQMQIDDSAENIRQVMFLNPYGGICTGDYDNDGMTDVYLTSPGGSNRLFRNLGAWKFEDVTESAGLDRPEFWGTGATFVDIDNDGDLDIYACGYAMPNQLWINEGGKFTEQAKRYGLDFDGASMTMAFADIDNDGDLDGYLATTALKPPPGTEFRVVFEGNKPVVPPHLKEYWDLVYLPGERAVRVESGQYDHLFRNDGQRFTEVTDTAGIDGNYFTLSATWWDYDGDGWQDLYVSNDYTGPDRLYRNNRDGTFTDVIRQTVGHTPWFSMGSDLADVNNDGLIDFFASDMSASSHYREKVMMGNMDDNAWFLDYAEPRQFMRNALYLNSGTKYPFEIAFQSGLSSSDWTWSPRLEDFDNDGRVDVFATNGILRDMMNSDLSGAAANQYQDGSREWAEFWAAQPMYKEANVAFRGMGDLQFQPMAKAWGLDRVGVSFGAATADFDNDGDLDLIVNNADTQASVYENRSTTGHRAIVRLRGNRSNHYGIGAVVQIEAGGTTHARSVTLNRGWLSASDPSLHFGLGEASRINRLSVHWPSGTRQVLHNLPVDHRLTITEPNKTSTADTAKSSSPHFAKVQTTARHQENEFDDFALQPLLPNRQSQMGPALAIGDIDGDGDQDAYLGGAKGFPGQLLVNHTGELRGTSPNPWSDDKQYEDVAALFFDADQDGDLDLYVVSGSNEWPTNSPQYRDRLYVNQGSGRFMRSTEALPNLADSGSCVAAADFDRDGDLDLFVGGRGLPGSYPLPANSRLLRNDKGHFADATPSWFASLGIVTDAIWTDVNQDQLADLMLTTEWGPVRVLLNEGTQLADRTDAWKLAERTGWWSALDAADLDGDGDIDLVVANFGLNTKYKASEQKPELLYYGDLDGTGKQHIVEAKYEAGRCLPRRGFSCSKNAMPFLDEKLTTFHNFAIATLPELYSQQRLDQCQRFEINTLTSGILVNQGGHFEFRPLPSLAQIAPSLDLVVADVDQDTHLDIVMAQNFYAPQRETGRMDGGLSLWLKSNGKGDFDPVWPNQSGIHLRQDTRRVAAADMNQDGKVDLVFGANNGPVRVLFGRPD